MFTEVGQYLLLFSILQYIFQIAVSGIAIKIVIDYEYISTDQIVQLSLGIIYIQLAQSFAWSTLCYYVHRNERRIEIRRQNGPNEP